MSQKQRNGETGPNDELASHGCLFLLATRASGQLCLFGPRKPKPVMQACDAKIDQHVHDPPDTEVKTSNSKAKAIAIVAMVLLPLDYRPNHHVPPVLPKRQHGTLFQAPGSIYPGQSRCETTAQHQEQQHGTTQGRSTTLINRSVFAPKKGPMGDRLAVLADCSTGPGVFGVATLRAIP